MRIWVDRDEFWPYYLVYRTKEAYTHEYEISHEIVDEYTKAEKQFQEAWGKLDKELDRIRPWENYPPHQ